LIYFPEKRPWVVLGKQTRNKAKEINPRLLLRDIPNLDQSACHGLELTRNFSDRITVRINFLVLIERLVHDLPSCDPHQHRTGRIEKQRSVLSSVSISSATINVRPFSMMMLPCTKLISADTF